MATLSLESNCGNYLVELSGITGQETHAVSALCSLYGFGDRCGRGGLLNEKMVRGAIGLDDLYDFVAACIEDGILKAREAWNEVIRIVKIELGSIVPENLSGMSLANLAQSILHMRQEQLAT